MPTEKKTLVAPAAARSPTATAIRGRLSGARQRVEKREAVSFPELADDSGTPLVMEARTIGLGLQQDLERRGFTEAVGADGVVRRVATADLVPLLVIYAACDPVSGERLYADTPEDRAEVDELPPVVANRFAPAALRVLGMSAEAAESLQDPSDAAAAGAPSSTSPAS